MPCADSDDSALTGAQSPGKRPSSGSRRDSNNSIISMIREKCTSSSKHDCPSPSQHSASSPRPAAASQLTAEALRQCALERRHSSDSSDSTVSHSSGHSSAEREAIKDAALQAQRDAASAAAQKAAAQAAAQAAAIAIAKEPLFGHPRYRKLRSVNRSVLIISWACNAKCARHWACVLVLSVVQQMHWVVWVSGSR